MLLRSRGKFGVVIIILAAALAGVGWVIYSFKLALLTAKLDQRPMTAGIIGAVLNMQPATINSGVERMIGSALYEGLTGYNFESGNLEPKLARSWEFAHYNTSLIFTLREGVTFHNGEKLTAEIIKQTWETNLMRNGNYVHYPLLKDLVGIDDFFNGKKPTISGIEANGNQLIIRFEKPNTAFPAILTSSLFWVNYPGKENEVPAGTGPYQLQARSPELITLVPFADYYNGMPKLTSVRLVSYPDAASGWQAYVDGKLDYLDQLPEENISQVLADPERRELLFQQPLMEYYAYEFQMGRMPFANNYSIRRALNYAIDREQIIQNLLGSNFIKAKGVIPQGVKGYRKERLGYQHNPDLANQLLDQAGYAERNKLETLYLTYNDNIGHRAVASELVRQFRIVGVKVQPVEVQWDYYRKQIPQMAYSWFRVGWAANYADADDFLFSLYHSRNIGVTNYNGYHNPQVDQLLEASRQEASQDERIKLLQKAEDLILDDASQLWLFQKQANKIISPSLKNFMLNSMEELDWKELALMKEEE